MKTATKTRTQRRMEKKQALLLLVVVLAVSLASFTLGVVVGQRGAERDLAMKQQESERVLVAKVPPRSAPLAAVKPTSQPNETDAPPPERETELTFYDKLAKESSAPLGSGINLPPEQEKAPAASKPPIDLPAQPIVKKETTAVAAVAATPSASAAVAPAEQPKVFSQGSFSLQVGSFASAADAGKLKKRLLDKGYPAFIVEADLGKKGIWYRVRLGPYADEKATKSMQTLLEEREKIKGFISRQ